MQAPQIGKAGASFAQAANRSVAAAQAGGEGMEAP